MSEKDIKREETLEKVAEKLKSAVGHLDVLGELQKARNSGNIVEQLECHIKHFGLEEKKYAELAGKTESIPVDGIERLRSVLGNVEFLLMNDMHLAALHADALKRYIFYGNDFLVKKDAGTKERFEENEKNICNIQMLRLIHYLLGMISEIGEVCDSLHGVFNNGKELDKVNLLEELGDQKWYMAIVCNVLGTDLEQVGIANIRKLAARHGDKFSNQDVSKRDLSTEREILEDHLSAIRNQKGM